MTRPSRGSDELRPLGDALGDLSRHLRMAPPAAVQSVFGGWRELVGEAMATHATPRTLRDGILTIVVDDPVWATQIRFLEGDLIRRFQAAGAGADISAIRVIVTGANHRS